ncbi:MAG: amidohydrolase family protein [Oscillospiraceae bacterium]|nr:amidohydrolase family protein [Oscillospiraceae bacterium]
MKLGVSNFEYSNVFQANLNKASYQAKMAFRKGCNIIIFHEWFLGINPVGEVPNKVTESLCQIAKDNKIMVVTGGIRYNDKDGKTLVGSFVIDDVGKIISVQNKINLYENEKKWIQSHGNISSIKTLLGNILILSGLDGLNKDYVYNSLENISDNIDLIIFQCTEFDAQGANNIRILASEVSKNKNCTAVIAGIRGFFYEQKCMGESVIIKNGLVDKIAKSEDEVLIGFESATINIKQEVIDAHVHIVFRDPGDPSVDTKVQKLIEKSIDVPIKSSIINYMNRAGIDRSIIFDWSGALKNDYVTSNEKVMEISQYSDRFIGFGVPSPKDPNVVDMLDKLNVRGLKVNPGLQIFYPNSPEFLKVCERVNKYKLPILIHTGPESAGRLKYDLPLLIDDIAMEYPDLKIIFAHVGVRGFTSDQAIMIAEKNANVYVETSWADENLIKRAIRCLGADKVIFGSDFPSRNPITELKKIQKLLEDKFIAESDYNKVVGGNILNIIRG